MASIVRWAGDLEAIYARQRGGQLAWLYTPHRVVAIPGDNGPHARLEKLMEANQVALIQGTQLSEFLGREVSSSVPQALKDITIQYFALLKNALAQDYNSVVNIGLQAVDKWIDAIKDGELPGWTSAGLASLVGFCIDTANRPEAARDEAPLLSEVDEPAASVGGSALTRKIINGLRKHIGKFRGNENEPNNIGVFTILLSESIRLCLQMNNPPMATAFLKTIPSHQQLPACAQRAPAARFKYYYGNLMLQKDNVNEGLTSLRLALIFCPPRLRELRTQIYSSFLVCKLRTGCVPKDPRTLLSTHGLLCYEPIVTAWISGNMYLYDQCLEKNSDRFYRDGTILSLNKLRFYVQQSLCRRVCDFLTSKNHQPANIIDLSYFRAAFRISSRDELIDDEETMCILANLIQLGFVKGYLAWKPKKIVLSKLNPFPTNYR